MDDWRPWSGCLYRCRGAGAHGTSVSALYDYSKQRMKLAFDRPMVLRQILQACAKGAWFRFLVFTGECRIKSPLQPPHSGRA